MYLPLDWVTICPEGQYYDSFYNRNYFPSTVSYIVDTLTDYPAYCNRELITTVLLNAVAGGRCLRVVGMQCSVQASFKGRRVGYRCWQA